MASRPMRIHLAGLWQETNSFSPYHTTLDNFERGYLLERREIPDRLGGTNTEIGGFIDVLRNDPGVHLCPGFAAWAAPAGPLDESAFDHLLERVLSRLTEDLPVDGVLLSLHGALISEKEVDCEGVLLERIRELIGEEVPIVCSLDFHAAVTEKMVRGADVLIGYRTYPHIDYAKTGDRAAHALRDILLGKRSLTTLSMS